MIARRIALASLALTVLVAPATPRAQTPRGEVGAAGAPPPLREATVTERPGEPAALDTRVTDARGRTIPLRDAISAGRPTLLVLAYYRCTMLCGLVLDGSARAVASLARPADGSSPLVAGHDFNIVTVSIDPRDTPADATAKRADVFAKAGVPAGTDWWFTTAGETDVRRLASSIGFGYAFDDRSGQYAHAAVVTVLTADGRVSSYLYGVDFPPADVRAALDEAAANRSRSSIGRLLLQCFHYLPSLRAWQGWMVRYYRIGGVLILAGLGVVLAALVRHSGAGRAVGR